MGSMTADQPQMTVEEFEELARSAPETVTLEFIAGKIGVKPVPDGDHGEIIVWLMKRCMEHRPELSLYPEQNLKVERYRNGRARPDGLLAPEDTFAGKGEWPEPEGVLMAVEVTSHDSDANQRDRVEKPEGYADAGIPVFLLIDRDDSSLTVHSDPEDGKYRSKVTRPYGATIEIPDPVGITLETGRLKDYAS